MDAEEENWNDEPNTEEHIIADEIELVNEIGPPDPFIMSADTESDTETDAINLQRAFPPFAVIDFANFDVSLNDVGVLTPDEAPSNSESEEEQVSNQDDEPNTNPIVGSNYTRRTFDTNLPTEHSYLGNDMESIRGRTVFEDNQILKMHVLPSDVIVCPGYTLPLTYSPQYTLIRSIMAQDRTFGLTFALDNDRRSYSQLGVTMEIYEYAVTSQEIKLKAKGRQRFRILKRDEQSASLYEIQILPDIQLPPILQNIKINSLNRHRIFVRDKATFKKNNIFRKWDASQTRLPIWIYNSFDEQLCVQEIRAILKNFKEFLPTDPMQLSYWVIQNFLLSRKERLDTLTQNCSIQRLKLLLEQIQTRRNICCARCNKKLASQEELFPMSKDGLQNNFVNPGGVVHETMTVLTVTHVSLVGQPHTDFSWFPGYAWTIAQCKKCNSHVGWLFSATNPDFRPHSFYGLTRSCVTIVITKGDEVLPEGKWMNWIKFWKWPKCKRFISPICLYLEPKLKPAIEYCCNRRN